MANCNTLIDMARDKSLDLEGRPKVWRVYVRRERGENSKGEVAKAVTKLPNV